MRPTNQKAPFMFKLYKTNRDLQLEWMKQNPGKTIALNVGLLVLYIAYIEWKDRQFETSLFHKTDQK